MFSLTILVLMVSACAALDPVADLIPHNSIGDYIDEVQGKPYSCQMDIAFVVDTSPSIGREVADKMIVGTLVNIQNQLARLPNAPGDDSQGSALHVVVFGKEAKAFDIQSVGARSVEIKNKMSDAVTGDGIDGGSCIACGFQKAMEVLGDNSDSKHKYIILLSDGFDNDRSKVSALNPRETAGQAHDAGITVFTLGIIGNKGSTDEVLLTELASNPSNFWVITSTSGSIYDSVVALIDSIAGSSCLG